MANLNSIFLEFNKRIRLPEDKRTELITVRDNLRQRIYTGFRFVWQKVRQNHTMEFQSQGSFVMDTIIRPEHDDYDIDDGLYFIGTLDAKNRPTPEQFHQWVCQALGDDYDDIEKVIDKTTCVRVQYKDGFHVDIPIYYANNVESPELADKAKGWILSHPLEFIDWFERKISSGFQKRFLMDAKLYPEFEKWASDIRKADHQLRRIVRYLKAWADLRREEMPCGIIMTILAANNYSPSERDDVSLKETLVNIQAALRKKFECLRPTTPAGEDLLAGYKNKEAFLKYLGYFIDYAIAAMAEPNEKTACNKWKEILGKRFPCDMASDRVLHNAGAASLAAGTLGKKPWGGIKK
jgi:hypothetical protein